MEMIILLTFYPHHHKNVYYEHNGAWFCVNDCCEHDWLVRSKWHAKQEAGRHHFCAWRLSSNNFLASSLLFEHKCLWSFPVIFFPGIHPMTLIIFSHVKWHYAIAEFVSFSPWWFIRLNFQDTPLKLPSLCDLRISLPRPLVFIFTISVVEVWQCCFGLMTNIHKNWKEYMS